MNKKSIMAALLGGCVGAFLAYLVQLPVVTLAFFLLGGAVAVVFYRCFLRESSSARGAIFLGLQTGIIMSVLLAITTVMTTGLHTIEFTAAVTFFPLLITILSIIGGWGAAVVLNRIQPGVPR